VLDTTRKLIVHYVDVLRKENNVPTVYVVQEMPNHNISSAIKYGDVQILLPHTAQIAFSIAPIVRRLMRALHNFKDEDYLLLTGDPVAIGLTCAVAAQANSGRFNVLKWDRREYLYIPVKINLYQKGEGNE
jgi:hypothetical protein